MHKLLFSVAEIPLNTGCLGMVGKSGAKGNDGKSGKFEISYQLSVKGSRWARGYGGEAWEWWEKWEIGEFLLH